MIFRQRRVTSLQFDSYSPDNRVVTNHRIAVLAGIHGTAGGIDMFPT